MTDIVVKHRKIRRIGNGFGMLIPTSLLKQTNLLSQDETYDVIIRKREMSITCAAPWILGPSAGGPHEVHT